MGSCVSFKTMEPAVKPGKKDDKLLVKEKVDTGNSLDSMDTNPPFDSSGFRRGGCKDEAFFDSQPWLDSDCENDFYSVNGDLTPSYGSTPVHHSFHSLQPTINPSVGNNTSSPEPSPTESKKKRLSELFRESFGGDEAYMELTSSDPQKDTNGKGGGEPYLRNDDSGSFDGKTSNKEMNGKEKDSKTTQCCIPMLIRNWSMNGRRKKMSPAQLMA